MNMQALMQQAQRMQKELTKKKEELNKKVFNGKSELVDVEVSGERKVLSVKFKSDSFEKDDLEVLQDMVAIAMNDALAQIDKETESMLGAYGGGQLGGLF